MADKASLISEAQKLLAKGQLDKALAKWDEVARAFPEGNTFNFIGDLYLKKGEKTKAMETFHKAARVYTDEGFSLKALALYKKILNINPQDVASLIALGELNEEKKLIPDAIKYYLAATDSLFKDRRLDEVPKVYDRIIRLAPRNINLRIKIADKFTNEGFITEASREHYQVGNIYLESNDMVNAEKHLSKAVEMRPSNREAIYALSTLYGKKGDLQRALQFNRSALERLGDDIKLLVNTARILTTTGELEEASSLIFKVLAKEPGNSEARLQLADLYMKTGDPDKAWHEYKAVIDEFLRTGKNDEAIEMLITHKDLDPVANRKRLANIYKHSGKDDLAVLELLELHDIFYFTRSDRESALDILREAYEIQPYNLEVKEKMDHLETPEAGNGTTETWPSQGISLDETTRTTALGFEPPVPLQETPQPQTEPAMGSWPELDSESTSWPSMDTVRDEPPSTEGAETPLVEDLITEADIFIKYGKLAEAKEKLESLKVHAPSNLDVHLRLKSLYMETGDIEQAVTECLILSMLNARLGNDENRIHYLREAYMLNPADPRLESRLDEIRSPALQPEQAQPAPDITPEQESIMKEYEPLEQNEPAVEPVDSDVMDIFDEFKRGLEKEIEAEDSETHYNLGIAYKEMGLIDDSIKEFQVAQHDPVFQIQASTMLGLCYMEKALYSLATEAFTSALMKTAPGDEGAWRLKYDLADAYEKDGKSDEALRLFTEVYGWNANYREVSAKIAMAKQSAASSSADKPKEKRSRVSYI